MSRSRSSRSASRSRQAARSSTLRFDQSAKPLQRARSTELVRRAALGIGAKASGGADRFRDPLQLRPVVEIEALAVLPRPAANRSCGSGIEGWRVPPTAAIFVDRIGEQIRVGQPLVGELVDEGAELAPFSSSRRTR